ncbi:DUF2007 domain-containing protein [Thermoanaerobacterium sp. RBIITD]|uniref:putative signal transducing protein n=1 Tax=Thermoanaerobacterium sp. RBIITD TaxID=1550240 RepID=UPI000BB897FB|nr:DUF2007 domain-containing protein [Thermoanaerobacterium sp. RBIITD]SNX54531.1 Putative signal transducing protein [Thermoanaerobacterium sp. RBIITD]
MSRCPKYGKEYNDDVHNVDLEDVKEMSSNSESKNNDKEALLTSVYDDIEADIVESLLNSYDIPVLKKYKGAGVYMKVFMGKTKLGIDIYVPSKFFDKAKEILESKPECDNANEKDSKNE